MKSFANKKSIFLNSKQTFLILLFIQTLVLAYVLIFCSIKYEVSDDFIMELLLSGGYTGQLNWHLPFSNPIWGIILAALYKVFSRSVSWYLIALLLVGFASYISISWVFSHKNNKIIGITVTVLLTMATAGDVYVLPQFTKTAAVAIVAGSILFIYGLFSAKKVLPVLCGTGLTIIGTLIRFSVIYAVAIPVVTAALICLIKTFIKSPQKLKWIVQKLLPCALLVILIFGMNIIGNKIFNSDSDYAYYNDYNSARSRIVDYAHVDYEEFGDELWNIGIGQNDYYLLIKWNFGDQDKFSRKNLKSAADILDKYRVDNELTFENMVKHINDRGYISYPIVWCILLLGVICIMANWRRLWIPLLCIVTCLFYIVLFYHMGRTVYRVEFGFLFAAAVVMAWSADREHQCAGETIRIAVCAALSCLAIGYMGVLWFPRTSEATDGEAVRNSISEYLYNSWDYMPEKYSIDLRHVKPYENFTELAVNNPDNIYMLEFATTIQTYYYNFSPFRSGANVFPDNVFWIADQTTEFPSRRKWKGRHDIRSTLKSLINDNVYYVGNKLDELVEVYLSHNGYPDVAERELIDVIDGYNIYNYYEE